MSDDFRKTPDYPTICEYGKWLFFNGIRLGDFGVSPVRGIAREQIISGVSVGTTEFELRANCVLSKKKSWQSWSL